MTRGTTGKLRVIFYGLLACWMVSLGWVFLQWVAIVILGFNIPEALFGDYLERLEKENDSDMH